MIQFLPMAGKTHSLQSLIRSLAPSLPRDTRKWNILLDWPPDIFGIAAYVLHKTGAYRHVVSNRWWKTTQKKHAEKMTELGARWLDAVARKRQAPASVRGLWNKIMAGLQLPVLELDRDENKDMVAALLDLLAIADSACVQFGLPPKKPLGRSGAGKLLSDVLRRAEELLFGLHVADGTSTLAMHIDPLMLCVLPKTRTPQTGLTIRSLSHHLAIWPRDETSPYWNVLFTEQSQWEASRFNLLLVPWPYEIKPDQFSASDDARCGRHFMDEHFRCFDYTPPDSMDWIEKTLPSLLDTAVNKTNEDALHGVVFPELAFRNATEFSAAYRQVQKVCPGAFLLAGVAEDDSPEPQAGNHAWFAAPLIGGDDVIFTQAKHHRWQLNEPQIQRYHLTKRLQTAKLWWESSPIAPRSQLLLALKPWMAFSFLICEDLARQEPAARLLRSIGPNLIIALLLDGQQLEHRWPGRYASVLAEDPGSSVLTLTSLGMVVQGKTTAENAQEVKWKKEHPGDRHRTCNIGLWRDFEGSTTPVAIDQEDHGVVLSLKRLEIDEYSADGRKSKASALVIKYPEKDIIPVRLVK